MFNTIFYGTFLGLQWKISEFHDDSPFGFKTKEVTIELAPEKSELPDAHKHSALHLISFFFSLFYTALSKKF